VKSKTLQAALEQAYKNRLFTGRFPSCVLYITLRHSDVDVNVHPAKTEVKFVREHQVFDGVYYASLSALEGLTARLVKPADDNRAAAEHPATAYPPGDPLPSGAALPFNGTMPRDSVLGAGMLRDKPLSGAASGGAYRRAYRQPAAQDAGASAAAAQSLFKGLPAVSESSAFTAVRDSTRQNYTTYAPAPSQQGLEEMTPTVEQLHMEAGLAPEAPVFRLIGEALGTYILVERGGSLWLIDKHAAHERLHFDRLKRERQVTGSQNALSQMPASQMPASQMPASQMPASQMLVQPVICDLGSEDTALLLEHAAVFETLGFALDAFGEAAVAVRQVPADIDGGDVDGLLGQAAQLLRRGGKPDDGLLVDELLHMVACKAAIKAGKHSSLPELEALAARVMAGEVTHCPHGRPVAVELTKAALDKSFKRV
jgi:DNA mismatch repair protein MutL